MRFKALQSILGAYTEVIWKRPNISLVTNNLARKDVANFMAGGTKGVN